MLSGGAESKCSHSPTKTQRISTPIRSSFFPCSVMFPPVPLHFHKSRFKTKQRGRAAILKNAYGRKYEQDKSTCVFFRLHSFVYLSARLSVFTLRWFRWAADASLCAEPRPVCPAFLRTEGASFRTNKWLTKDLISRNPPRGLDTLYLLSLSLISPFGFM